MARSRIRVLKFGSSVLRSDADLSIAVHEVYRCLREGLRVVAVVSAVGGTTDELAERARRVAEEGEGGRALVLSAGETIAVGLLGLALERAGIPAELFDGARLGIRTRGRGLEASPSGVDGRSIRRALERVPVVVVPGFVGRNSAGGVTLLGRGGSDLTAVLLARELGSECTLLKDVDGIYESDPNVRGAVPRRFASLGWSTALRVGGVVVQDRALEVALRAKVPIRVARCAETRGTRVGAGQEVRVAAGRGRRVLRVGLLGHGTVGRAVKQELERDGECFELVRVLVRDASLRQVGLRPGLATESVEGVLAADPDVVVEALPAGPVAARALERVLDAGCDVVSANKAVLASSCRRLDSLAKQRGARLRASAAVGGSLPVLETLSRCRREGDPVLALEGVLNGTTNFILDRMGEGERLASALGEAQERGFAERDARRDLGGLDVVAKLELAAQAASGHPVEVRVESVVGIDGVDARRVWMARSQGRATRLLGRLELEGSCARISVSPVEFDLDHPFARCAGASNRVCLTRASGESLVLEGLGAGGVPTATSILGDLHALRRTRNIKASTSGTGSRSEHSDGGRTVVVARGVQGVAG